VRDSCIGAFIGLVIALLSMLLVHSANIGPNYFWAAPLFIGTLGGLAARWDKLKLDLVSLGAGFILVLGITLLMYWKVPMGIIPVGTGAVGFLLGAALRTHIGKKNDAAKDASQN
jgi:hypothetical protein